MRIQSLLLCAVLQGIQARPDSSTGNGNCPGLNFSEVPNLLNSCVCKFLVAVPSFVKVSYFHANVLTYDIRILT